MVKFEPESMSSEFSFWINPEFVCAVRVAPRIHGRLSRGVAIHTVEDTYYAKGTPEEVVAKLNGDLPRPMTREERDERLRAARSSVEDRER